MNRFCAVASACICLLSFGRLAAADVVAGPYEDFRGRIEPSSAAQATGTLVSKDGWNLKDNVKVFWDGATGFDMRGAMFITSQTPDFSGDLVFTTIYGFDGNPGASELSVFGFDPVPIAAALNLFDERMIGNSGTEYAASVALRATPGELSAFLPGYDLSAFHGAPDSIFFVFQTNAPGADFTVVPEPSTLSLLIAGAAVALLARRRVFRRR